MRRPPLDDRLSGCDEVAPIEVALGAYHETRCLSSRATAHMSWSPRHVCPLYHPGSDRDRPGLKSSKGSFVPGGLCRLWV
jgi:hypothetical protein